MNKKLDVQNRLFNQTLAETLVDPETGEILLEKDELIDRRALDRLLPYLEKGIGFQEIKLTRKVFLKKRRQSKRLKYTRRIRIVKKDKSLTSFQMRTSMIQLKMLHLRISLHQSVISLTSCTGLEIQMISTTLETVVYVQ